jgi:hypothetical protein
MAIRMKQHGSMSEDIGSFTYVRASAALSGPRLDR